MARYYNTIPKNSYSRQESILVVIDSPGIDSHKSILARNWFPGNLSANSRGDGATLSMMRMKLLEPNAWTGTEWHKPSLVVEGNFSGHRKSEKLRRAGESRRSMRPLFWDRLSFYEELVTTDEYFMIGKIMLLCSLLWVHCTADQICSQNRNLIESHTLPIPLRREKCNVSKKDFYFLCEEIDIY